MCGVLQSLEQQVEDLETNIFSTVPQWFFEASLSCSFSCYPVLTDIGLIQIDPLHEDPEQTIEALDAFLPFDHLYYQAVIERMEQSSCDIVISDISPLGVYLADHLGLPSFLVENFTWDWIYEHYLGQFPAFGRFIRILRQIYAKATYHILAVPYCEEKPVDCITHPISRLPRLSKTETRKRLGIDQGDQLVIVSMGGIESGNLPLEKLHAFSEVTFLIPGDNHQLERHRNVIRIPHRTTLYHPDLIAASDAVISKIGYSTLAETYHSGKPFGYISRSQFRESPVLRNFIRSTMQAVELSEEDYLEGNWSEVLGRLLSLPAVERNEPSGAGQVASFILKTLGE